MNITSAKYMKDPMTGKNASIDIIINNEKLCVPLDPDNRHYQAIQEWVKEGNTIQEAD
jgi:hypothetical protein